jgi:uncharacterized protein YjbI with pentapeptide repeats
VKRWPKVPGLADAEGFLQELAAARSWKPAIARLDYWEREFLLGVVPRLRRFAGAARKPPRELARRLRSLATTLAILRGEAAGRNPGRFSRDQSRFRGRAGHLELLMQALGAPTPINEWNAWRKLHPKAQPDLRGVDLSRMNLQDVRLHGALLDGASLDGASSRVSDFRGASLVKAGLGGVDFSYTDMTGCDMRRAMLQDANFSAADFSFADLRDAILTGCVLNRARLHGTRLSGALVWGTGVWDVEYSDNKHQKGMLIGWDMLDPIDVAMSIEDQGRLRMPERSLVVDDLRVAHFMSLVRENENLAKVFDAASSSTVLLLGRFTGDQGEVLDALRDALPEHGYAPVVFDFEEPRDRDLIETVAMLAGLARFIIADLTDPRSTPLESQLTIPQIAIPWVPIIRAPDKPFSMFDALQRKYEWVLPTVSYRSVRGLLRQLERKVIRPAERLSEKLRAMKHD